MRYDEVIKKVKEGTAGEEDLNYLQSELERLKGLEQLLNDRPAPAEDIFEEPDLGVMKKARRVFLRKATFRTVSVILLTMAAVAAVVCGILFIPSCISAAGNQVLDRQECLNIAEEFLEEYSGEARETFYVRDIDKEVRIKNGLNDSLFVYEIKISTPNGVEYELEVSTRSGFVIIDDFDLIR